MGYRGAGGTELTNLEKLQLRQAGEADDDDDNDDDVDDDDNECCKGNDDEHD